MTLEEKEQRVPVLRLPRGVCLFPNCVQTLSLEDQDSVAMLDDCLWTPSLSRESPPASLLVACLPEAVNHETQETQETHENQESHENQRKPRIGCAARILQVERRQMQNESEAAVVRYRFVIQGLHRVRCHLDSTPIVPGKPWIIRITNCLEEVTPADSPEWLQMKQQLMQYVDALLQALKRYGLASSTWNQLQSMFQQATVGTAVDLLAHLVSLDIKDKVSILETENVQERTALLLSLLKDRISLNGDTNRAGRNALVKSKDGPEQRADQESEDIAEIQQKLDAAKLPESIQQITAKELRRLRKMNPMQAEHGVIRHYLEWIADLPWSTESAQRLDIQAARLQLDQDHYGLEKVKTRIIQYLAVRKLKQDSRGPILCFVGPPGVGKTSLGKSIAAALGKQFHRISLGGVHDVAEIKGHRRTYIGSMPGLIIHGLKMAKTKNPVFLLDEVDKLGKDQIRGDPTAALLEVLDPEQNSQFTDHYLNCPFDLSQVTFIATANQLETIPAPLLDRLEIIRIPGYTFEEKLHIARKYLLPKQLLMHGLLDTDIDISDETLSTVIYGYTREPGVRGLERELAAICRHVALEIADSIEKEGKRPMDSHIVVDEKLLTTILGPSKYDDDLADRANAPGVVNGLSWTSSGSGALLTIEATSFPGRGVLYLTGKLGEVLRESAQTALSWVRSNADRLNFPTDLPLSRLLPGPMIAEPTVIPVTANPIATNTNDTLQKLDIHIHFPAGAIPKDGPSAGIALVTTLVSLFMNRPVRPLLAMTGEVTLHGSVLPVGGIKEKILAAHRAGITMVILPDKNHKDVLMDIPDSVKAKMEFVYAKKLEDVLRIALGEDVFKPGGLGSSLVSARLKPDTNPIKVASFLFSKL